jgi:uncharacterized protein (TIGR00369 family)
MEASQPWSSGDLPKPLIELASSFEGFLDLDWLELTPQAATVIFETRENLKQPMGLLHGGVYSAVAETVASVATMAAVWRDGMTASGLSNTASFLRPVTHGTVEVKARLVGSDDREWLWSHDFRDEAGRLCALVDVMIAVRPSRSRGRTPSGSASAA